MARVFGGSGWRLNMRNLCNLCVPGRLLGDWQIGHRDLVVLSQLDQVFDVDRSGERFPCLLSARIQGSADQDSDIPRGFDRSDRGSDLAPGEDFGNRGLLCGAFYKSVDKFVHLVRTEIAGVRGVERVEGVIEVFSPGRHGVPFRSVGTASVHAILLTLPVWTPELVSLSLVRLLHPHATRIAMISHAARTPPAGPWSGRLRLRNRYGFGARRRGFWRRRHGRF
jgi:hypothetical protein